MLEILIEKIKNRKTKLKEKKEEKKKTRNAPSKGVSFSKHKPNKMKPKRKFCYDVKETDDKLFDVFYNGSLKSQLKKTKREVL